MMDEIQPLSQSQPQFTLFPNLPTEIRSQIYRLSIQPRIIRWTVQDSRNIFIALSNSLLLSVNRESRELALFYGKYFLLPCSSKVGTEKKIWFSPIIDYLFFDAGWTNIVNLPNLHPYDDNRAGKIDMLSNLDGIERLKEVRNILIHPNYTENRMRPASSLDKFEKLERVLIATDEKSLGSQRQVMFLEGSKYDVWLYYHAYLGYRDAGRKVPYIGIGCLGWEGEERRAVRHGKEDKRILVGVFDDEVGIRKHMEGVREEQARFLKERRRDTRIFAGRTGLEREVAYATPDIRNTTTTMHASGNIERNEVDGPPAYDEIAGFGSGGGDAGKNNSEGVKKLLKTVKVWLRIKRWQQKSKKH